MQNKGKLAILFVCHGNICRSPMAEFAMKDMAAKAGVGERLEIESAAATSEEIGNPVYPPVKALLREKGISCGDKTARQMTPADYDRFDIIVGMDSDNIRRIKEICNGDPLGKVRLLKSFCGEPQGQVADPWYTGDFSETWRDITAGCAAILRAISAL